MLSPVVQFVLSCTFGSAYLSMNIIVYQYKFSTLTQPKVELTYTGHAEVMVSYCL